MKAVLTKAMLIAAAAATLGGCSSYGNERPRFAYFIVPCNTPGAIAAQPVNTADNAVIAQPQEPLPDTTNPAQSADTSQKTQVTCLVAAASSRPWTSGYAEYGFPSYFSYPYRRSGGIGVVLHGGGHRGGHHGGGHRRH